MRYNRAIFSILVNMKVCGGFFFESPHEAILMSTTIYHLQYNKENRPKLSQICSNVFISKGLKNEFETAVVNEPSVFEPTKFYCNVHGYALSEYPLDLQVSVYILIEISS